MASRVRWKEGKKMEYDMHEQTAHNHNNTNNKQQKHKKREKEREA